MWRVIRKSDKNKNCKVFTAFQLFEVFSHIKSLQCMALIHAENGSLISKKTQMLKEKGLSSHPDAILSARDEDVSRLIMFQFFQSCLNVKSIQIYILIKIYVMVR